MKRCWLAALPDAGPCDGRLVRCHLISQQVLRREVGRGWRKVADDPRSWVWGCGGPTGVGGHHGRLDYSRSLRIPRELLPPAVEELGAELGLGWWLDRTYGGPSPEVLRQVKQDIEILSVLALTPAPGEGN